MIAATPGPVKLAVGLLLTLLVCACTEDDSALSPAARRGHAVYVAACGSCHHPRKPWEEGPIGPAIAGSTRELLEAKVLHGHYPPGYRPKRNTHSMPLQAYLKDRIGDLAAYLSEVQRD